MRITTINIEKNEKRYTREELDEFVAQLKNGYFRQERVRDYHKEVCFAAEWQKQNETIKAKSLNTLVLLSLENLRDSTSSVPIPFLMASLQTQPCSMPSASCITSTLLSWVHRWRNTSPLSRQLARPATIHNRFIIRQPCPSL